MNCTKNPSILSLQGDKIHVSALFASSGIPRCPMAAHDLDADIEPAY